jgi:ERF superfamily
MSPKDSSPQGQGSAITYLRRYALSAVLGIATEDDDDGNAASSAKREPMKPYSVPRALPQEDEDESGAAIMSPEEIVEVQKVKIKKLVTALGKVPTPKAVRELSGLAFSEANYDAIIKRLDTLVDNKRNVDGFDDVIE